MKSVKKGIIVQARLGSSRLPGKVLLPFYEGQSILDIILDRFKALEIPLVLATSRAAADDAIAEAARKHGVACHRGSEQNVLERFVEAANQHEFEFAVRVCADNPFISKALFARLWERAEALRFQFDYLSFSYRSHPVILTHFGIFTEFVRVHALEEALEQTSDPFYLEHVTNYLYKHARLFDVKFIELDEELFDFPYIRLTVDTPEDFQISADIYKAVKKEYGNTGVPAINDYLKDHPEYLMRMKEQVFLNEKE